ncbi:MAG: fibronectin type III domain-containing protein [Bdellovibrionales bacterium]
MGRLMERAFGSKLRVLLVIAGSILSLTTTGCLTEGTGQEGGTDVVSDPAQTPSPPLTPPERTVCDPFSAGISARDRGLVGNLVYLTDDQPRYSSVHDYILNGTPVQSTLYFDKLMIPTRKFDLGFYTQDGRLITNHNDQPLYEYFGLRLETQIELGEGEPEGWYQLAILSDDGAVLSLKDDGDNLIPIVNNDGVHPTKMGCANESIYMAPGQKRKAVLEYYQGPRYHISMVLLWRLMPDGADPAAAVQDAQCGRSGNSMYFDYTKIPSEPTATYYEMLTRGWKPLGNENFYFPEQASNPCGIANPLLVTNFTIDQSTRTTVTVSWDTSEPSTSQVQVKDVMGGGITLSPMDPTPVLHHTVTVSGLVANTLYAVQAISTAGTQEARSEESAFRTPR